MMVTVKRWWFWLVYTVMVDGDSGRRGGGEGWCVCVCGSGIVVILVV